MPTQFRKMLSRGFASARTRGYVARQNFSCCQGCANAELPEGTEDYVYYHRQDADSLHEREARGRPQVWLSWGGDGEELRRCFMEAGLAVEWNGSSNQRLLVSLPPE